METRNHPQKRTITIGGLDCPDCAVSLERRIAALPGVANVRINAVTSRMSLEHTAPLETIIGAIREAGYEVATAEPEAAAAPSVFRLTGLDCADCAAKLETRLKAMDGVRDVRLNFATAKLTLSHTIPADAILEIIKEAGYGAEQESPGRAAPVSGPRGIDRQLLATAVSGVLLFLSWALSGFIPLSGVIALAVAAMIVGGFRTFRRGFSSVKSLTFDMNVMMTVAVAGAVIIGEWSEGATVAFLYSLSNFLESRAMERTRRSIRSLMDLTPKEATVRRGGVEMRVGVNDVGLGETVIVKPGERISVDGTVLAGVTSVDQSPITGESLPVDKKAGDEVYAGTINGPGSVEVRVTKAAADTQLAKIIHLVEEAQSQRAPLQAFVDRFAAYYTPAILALVAAVALVPPVIFSQPFVPWIYRALALVIVACPCALVISTPVAIISAIGNAARHGVLIKGGAYLEQAGSLRVIAFDKTGTLTRGQLEVTDVLPLPGVTEEELLDLAAAIEVRSEHPLARAILRRARKEGAGIPVPDLFEALPGRGAKASFSGEVRYIGNPALFTELGVDLGDLKEAIPALQRQGKTVMIVGTPERIFGAVAVADEVRVESAECIRALHAAGVERVIMLSGDNEDTARAIGNRLGLEEVRAQLLPGDKVEEVKKLLEKYGRVAMVGDGINDAPALATATVGIAMGAAGTDTALETADIVLMSDDLTRLPYTIRLSRRTLAIIRQNIAFSILTKVLTIGLIFPGWLTLWLAVLTDMGASLLVTLNGMRLMAGKPARGAVPHMHGGPVIPR